MKKSDKRHPKLDLAWEQHQGLIWYWARRLKLLYGGSTLDYLGLLFQRLNRSLWNYKPELGVQFSTYFSSHIIGNIRFLMRKDSDFLFLKLKRTTNPNIFKPTVKNGTKIKIPFKDHRDYMSWTLDLMDEMGGKQKAWNFLKINLTDKEAMVVYRKIAEGHTFQDIGVSLGRTRARVEQIFSKAIVKMKRRLFNNKTFKSLTKRYVVKLPLTNETQDQD